MTRQAKLIISILICSLIVTSIAFIMLLTGSPDHKTPKTGEEPLPKAEVTVQPEPQAAEASVQSSHTEKYILKYNEQSDTVYLITKKTDGTEIISPVESINPFYLTDEDLAALTAGIELTQREDMFILIEDFSS